MKSLIKIMVFITVLSFFGSCKKDDTNAKNKEIALPPKESMDFSFDKFKSSSTKSEAIDTSSMSIYIQAKSIVDFWSGSIANLTSIPTFAFYRAFAEKPEQTADYTWEWKYSVDYIGSTFNVRLVGVTDAEYKDVQWKMYVEKLGIGAYSEFLWFEGNSKTDNTSGSWTLYYSPEFQEKFITIDWTADKDNNIAEAKYTYVREKDNYGQKNSFNGSSIKFGKQAGELDAYFDINYYVGFFTASFVDVHIEWSTSTYNGRIQSQYHFKTSDWQCWSTKGYNTICK